MEADEMDRRKVCPAPPRSGFTLMELLVVMAIMIILAGISVPTFILAVQRNRYSGAARLVQSSLMRAKKLAIQERSTVSVELYQDPASLTCYIQLESKNAKTSGTASGGSSTSLVDGTRSWAANVWENGKLYVLSGATNDKYSAEITSSTNDTLYFKALPISVSAGDEYWVEAGIEQVGRREALPEGIVFAFANPAWTAKDGWVGSSDENDDYPDIAFRPDGMMADPAGEGQIVVKKAQSAIATERIVISVNKLTGFISAREE
jgi:prepilin-type N-terminal cleavage/methylation domain-containing protein